MSIPYIPGWWDSIDKNALGGFIGGATRAFAPDATAQFDLQNMVKQNPMLMEQFSNMDDGTRKLLEQSMGFKNKTPISQLPVGAERRQRELMQGLLGEILADPTGKEDFLKKHYGKRTSADVKKEGIDIRSGELGVRAAEQGININDLNTQLLTGKVKDMTRTQADIDKAMEAYPDLKGVNYKVMVRDAIRSGKPIDPALITATLQSDGAKALFEVAVKSELMGLENEYSMRLRTAKDPNTSALLLRTLTEQANQIETTQQRLMMQRSALSKEFEGNMQYNMLKSRAMRGDETAKKQLEEVEKPLKKIDAAISTYMQAGIDIQKRTEKYGDLIGLPKVKKEETPEERAARLRKLAGM